MSLNLNGNIYYRTAEVCRSAGVSKNTFLRWVREGVIQDVPQRDRRGWRIFTESDMQRVISEANRTNRNQES